MYHEIEILPEEGSSRPHVHHGAGTIRLHPVPPIGKIALAFFAVTTIVYFLFRIPLWNPDAPVLSSLLLTAEVFGCITLILHVISTWCLVERKAPPPPANFTADLFFTTWNESEDILRHTLLAAKQVAHARFIWLLDDGGRPTVAALAKELGVNYLSRQDRSHAKAGNLNNALKHTDAEFIAIFDCDHAPSPNFLERTLGYFIDPSVALVQTPQDFYNIDSFQHRSSSRSNEAWNEQGLFYRVIQAGKDFWNATFFCGSCAIVRRAAINDIGGFATGTITEDMHTSLRLHKNGWSAVYHVEALAFGLAPTDFEQYRTQRLRWGRGAMQVWRKEGIITSKGLTLAQRTAYFTSAITYFEGWQKAIIYLMPAIVLITGKMPLVWVGGPFLSLFALWLLTGILVNEIFSRGYSKSLYMEEYNFLRFPTFMRATLEAISPRNWKFVVTPKNLTSNSRLSAILWPQIFVAAASIMALPIGLIRFKSTHYLPAGAFAANLGWTTLVAIIAIRALKFSSTRSQQRRSDHRFPLPAIANLELPDLIAKPVPVIAQDISSNGFSFLFRGADTFGKQIKGTLRLPGQDLPFQADIVLVLPTADPGIRRISLRFRWRDYSEADPLNSILYGNAFQWDINGLVEAGSTSIWQRLKPKKSVERSAVGTWCFAALHSSAGLKSDCIVRAENGTFRVLSFTPFPATSKLRLTIGKGAKPYRNLELAGYRAYQAGSGTIHLAVLHQTGCPDLQGYHREPTWMKEAA